MSTRGLEAIVYHPRVAALGRTLAEQQRVNAFAIDLARWLHGDPHATLAPLARVVTLVARRELAGPRRLARNRPLLAIEAGARATEALWPLIRWEEPEPPDEEDDAPEEGSDDGQMRMSGSGGGGSAADDDEDADSGAENDAESNEEGAGSAEDDDSASGDGEDEGEPADDLEDQEDGEGDAIADLLERLAEVEQIDDPELQGLAAKLREQLGPADPETGLEQMMEGVGQATAEGALEADQVARTLEQFAPGVGWSLAPGQLQRRMLTDLGRLTQLIERMKELRELADALGRLEEADRRDGPTDGGREEVVGVHMGGDVATALPSELGLLGDPSTEDLFYQRFVERRLVTLELTGAGDEGRAQGTERGPIIACIDTSASMEGAREMAAKALVLAITRRALPQRRIVHLLLFGGPGERTELRLRRGTGGLEALLDFLAMTFSSGTDFDGPLLRAVELLEEQELSCADILVVTDGLGRAAPNVVKAVQEARTTHQLRVWSVVLGGAYTKGVSAFSDKVWAFDPTEAANAVGLLREIVAEDAPDGPPRRSRPWPRG